MEFSRTLKIGFTVLAVAGFAVAAICATRRFGR